MKWVHVPVTTHRLLVTSEFAASEKSARLEWPHVLLFRLTESCTYGVPIVELIVILFGLLAVATPPLTAFLLWRQRELRQQLLSLKQLSVERNDALHRELVELKRQVAALPLTLDPAAGSVQEASRRSFSAAPTSVTPTKTEKPAVPIAPAVEPAA